MDAGKHRGWASPGETTSDTSMSGSRTTRVPLRAFGSAPLATDRVELAVGELNRLHGIEGLAGLASLLLERGRDTVAAAGKLEVALVGEHDRLGPSAGADHDGLGVSAHLTKALEQRGQLSTCFAGGEHVVGSASHAHEGSTNVYTYAIALDRWPVLCIRNRCRKPILRCYADDVGRIRNSAPAETARAFIALRSRRRDVPRDVLDLLDALEHSFERATPHYSKADAASLLAVTPATLDKWVASGLVPTVTVPDYKRQRIPARALVDLATEVTELRRLGRKRGLLAEALSRLEQEDPEWRRQFDRLYGPGLAATAADDDPVSAAPGADWDPGD
jgi:hypothetical protein